MSWILQLTNQTTGDSILDDFYVSLSPSSTHVLGVLARFLGWACPLFLPLSFSGRHLLKKALCALKQVRESLHMVVVIISHILKRGSIVSRIIDRMGIAKVST